MFKKKILFLAVLLLFASNVCFVNATPNYDVHNITSNETLYLQDGDTQTMYDNTKGNCIISWKDRTDYAFFNARVSVPTGDNYEFQLISVDNCDDSYIDGVFNITKNGILVAPSIDGRLYGLDHPIGDYFKFYSDNFAWHMSAYITYRFDY